MLHTTLIVLHAGAGVVCFAAGVASLGLRTAASWRFRAHFASISRSCATSASRRWKCAFHKSSKAWTA